MDKANRNRPSKRNAPAGEISYVERQREAARSQVREIAPIVAAMIERQKLLDEKGHLDA